MDGNECFMKKRQLEFSFVNYQKCIYQLSGNVCEGQRKAWQTT